MPAPYCYEHPRPQVTVDLVVFALVESSLRVLLIRRGHDPFAGLWAIPGGFLEIDEPVGGSRQARAPRGDGPGDPGLGRADRLLRGTRPRPTRPHDHAGPCRGGPRGRTRRQGERRRGRGRLGSTCEITPELAFDHDEILSTARAWLKDRVRSRRPWTGHPSRVLHRAGGPFPFQVHWAPRLPRHATGCTG